MKKIISISLIMTIIMIMLMPCITLAVSSADNGTMKYYPARWGSSFDIQGKVNGIWQSTTFYDGGYHTYLQIGNGEIRPYDKCEKTGTESVMTLDGVELAIDLSFINEGRYVKITYTVKNTNAESKTINLGTKADVQIAGNDKAPVERYQGSRGLRLYDPEANVQFNFFGKNAAGITTPIDNLWIGEWGTEAWTKNTMIFENNTTENLINKDSAFGYSWTNKTIEGGQTKYYSAIIGIGEVSNMPVITKATNETEVYENTDVKIKALVSDIDANDEATIKYIVDNGTEQTLTGTIKGVSTPKEFTIDLSSAGLAVGNHKISIWAIDKQGNPSEIIDMPFIITNLKKPTIVMSEAWTKGEVKFQLTDTINDPAEVSKYEYKLGNGNWTTATLSTDYIALSTTGTIEVKARTVGTTAGEVSGTATKVAKVDLQKPQVVITETNSKAKITVTDIHSEEQKTEYAWANSSTQTPTTWQNYTNEFAYTGTEKGNVYLFVKSVDNVGNETIINKEYKAVEAPTIEGETQFVDKKVSYKLVDSKNSGQYVQKYEAKINSGNFQTVAANTNIEIDSDDVGTYTITARTVDVLGRISSETSKQVTVIKDNTVAPGKMPDAGIKIVLGMTTFMALISISIITYKKLIIILK